MYSGRKADHLIGKFTNSEHKCCFHTSFNILLVYLISQLCESMEIKQEVFYNCFMKQHEQSHQCRFPTSQIMYCV